jgi:E3 ubiquitin-protein ligase HERC2
LLGIQPVPLQTITNENPAGPSLGTIPQARFLLVMLSMLTLQHGANNLDLLLNSGTLALTQTALRLIGRLELALGPLGNCDLLSLLKIKL